MDDYAGYGYKGKNVCFGVDDILSFVDLLMDTKRKRHLVGGALLSMSLFFGGLAITTMTMKEEDS